MTNSTGLEDNLEDVSFDAELEGFLTGKGTVNLQPSPLAFGSEPIPSETKEGSAGPGASGFAGAAAAGAAGFAALAALKGGNLSAASGMVGDAMKGMVVPTSAQPMADSAGRLLGKAQPWKDFFLPLSIPAGAEGCSRITANLYSFQTNYVILFIVSLVTAVVMQPSALICIVLIVLVWFLFLKKNVDPEWKPTVGGVELGPVQRVLALAAITTILLLFMAGSTIFNSALMYCFAAICHGIIHDPSAKGIPGAPQEIPL